MSLQSTDLIFWSHRNSVIARDKTALRLFLHLLVKTEQPGLKNAYYKFYSNLVLFTKHNK